MWFVGLLLGALLGSLSGGGYGALWGSLCGALAGALISFSRNQSRQVEFDTRLAELKAVAGWSPEKYAQPEPVWKEVIAMPDADQPGEYLADLGGSFPLDRLALRLPQENTSVPVQFLARSKPEDKWTPVTRAVIYRLRQNGRELVSPDLAVGAPSRRYWRLRVDPAAGGIGSGPLLLRAGWTPREIVFTARGAGPFRLAYGNSKARPGALGIDTLVPGWRTAQEPRLAMATTGPAQNLAGESAARPRIDVKQWGLWAALFAAVAVLAWMAWRLSKQMQRPDAK